MLVSYFMSIESDCTSFSEKMRNIIHNTPLDKNMCKFLFITTYRKSGK